MTTAIAAAIATPRDPAPAVKRRRRDLAPHDRTICCVVTAGLVNTSDLVGIPRRTLAVLGVLGALEVTQHGRSHGNAQWRVRHAPGDDAMSIYRRWVGRVREWNVRTASTHRALRDTLAIPDTEPQPPGLLEFGARWMADIADFGTREARAFVHGDDVASQNRMRDIARRDRLRGARAAGGSLEELVERFPMLDGLPGTFLDAEEAGDAAPPDPALLGRCLVLGPAAATACWFAAIASSSHRPHNVKGYVRGLAAFDRELASLGAEGVSEPGHIAAAMEAMLARADAGEKRGQVAHTLMRVVALSRLLRRAARLQDPDGRRGLARLVPGEGPQTRALRRRINDLRRSVKRRGMRNRKQVSDRIADRLKELVRIARFRTEQVLATAEDLKAARLALEARPAPAPTPPDAEPWGRRHRRAGTMPYEEVIVETTVLTWDGRLVPGASQECVWWAWRECDLLESLAPGAMRRLRGKGGRLPQPDLRRTAQVDLGLDTQIVNARRDPQRFQRVFYELRAVRPANGGTVAHEPFFATHARLGLFLAPALCEPQLQRRRHQGIRFLRMPVRAGLPGGLVGWDRVGGTLAKRLLERNRVIVPIENVHGGTALASLAEEAVFETLCRGHELVQARQDPEGWKEDSATGRTTMGWMATRKVPRNEPVPPPSRFQVTDALFVQFMETATTVAELNGHGRWLPAVRPAYRVDWKAPEEAAIIMQWARLPLQVNVVSYLVGILFTGCERVTLHPLRHAGSNFLRECGMSERHIQILLGHRDPRQSRWYDAETAAQMFRSRAGSIRGRRVADATRAAREAASATHGENRRQGAGR